MALLVQKFGGTSVGSVERIKAVARRIAISKEEGHDVVVKTTGAKSIAFKVLMGSALQKLSNN